ncbi:anti-sigma factor family protein, partial [Nitrospinota bacterium]
MNRDDALLFVDAYVDDELDVKEALEVQAWIEKDETCRSEYDRVLSMKAMLREKLGSEGGVASDLLKQRVKKAMRRESMRRVVWFRPSVAAAAVITLFILGWAGYQRAFTVPTLLVADTMMVYRVESGNPLDVRSGDTQKISSWLAGKFKQNVSMVELKGEILGARLCPFVGKKGAVIQYRYNNRSMALFIGDASGVRHS